MNLENSKTVCLWKDSLPGARGLRQVEGPEVDSRDAELAVLGPFAPGLKSLL